MILEILAALIALLAAILPPIIAAWSRRLDIKNAEADSLQRRSLDELHVIRDRVRASQPPVQP